MMIFAQRAKLARQFPSKSSENFLKSAGICCFARCAKIDILAQLELWPFGNWTA